MVEVGAAGMNLLFLLLFVFLSLAFFLFFFPSILCLFGPATIPVTFS